MSRCKQSAAIADQAVWMQPIERLAEILKSRRLTQQELNAMVAKHIGFTVNNAASYMQAIVTGMTRSSAFWVITARVLGLKLGHLSDSSDWIKACELAYDRWITVSDVGKKAHKHITKQTIWTNKLTGEQIDPATATQAKEEQPMKAPATQTKPFPAGVLPAPSIVELAAQFEVAQKRLVAAAAEHKAAQDALETLRAQLAAAIKP